MKSELPILKINSKNKFSGKFYRFSMATQSSLVRLCFTENKKKENTEIQGLL